VHVFIPQLFERLLRSQWWRGKSKRAELVLYERWWCRSML